MTKECQHRTHNLRHDPLNTIIQLGKEGLRDASLVAAIVGGVAFCWRRVLRSRVTSRKSGSKAYETSAVPYTPLTEITTVKSS